MTNATLDYYNNNSEELSIKYEGADVKSLWSELLSAFANNNKLLEIGCGSGRDASWMLKHGFQVQAIDGSLELIRKALTKHPELEGKIIQVILPSKLPFVDNCFDGIYSIACLMHLELNQINKVLDEIKRVVKPNAPVFISVPINRGDVCNGKDDKGRTFTLLKLEKWKTLFNKFNLITIQTNIRPDGLGRENIDWATFTLRKESKLRF